MTTSCRGLEFLSTGNNSICLTISCPATTWPNTTWILKRTRNFEFIVLKFEQFQILTRQDAVQVVLYYNNNKEIKGEKKHLGNSVYSIKGSHHFVEVEICKCNEKGREKKFLLNFLSGFSCLHCLLVNICSNIRKKNKNSLTTRSFSSLIKVESKSLSQVYKVFSYMKNWEPFVLAPRFAIDSKNGLSCLKMNPSSGKLQKISCDSRI